LLLLLHSTCDCNAAVIVGKLLSLHQQAVTACL